ncbi:MAG: deoxyribose-phosphate aldolase [Anaerolineaceae bacterium]|nr:deoxyribose-phosphate aldolase [Anaerolineaceae bacterium]
MVSPSEVQQVANRVREGVRSFQYHEKGELELPQDFNLASYIDHTAVTPDVQKHQVVKLCEEAKYYGFSSVFVTPTQFAFCVKQLEGSSVKACSVAGFPLGAIFPEIKILETKKLIQEGANEVDMVINVGWVKDGCIEEVVEDILGVVHLGKEAGVAIKVIIETGLLSFSERILATYIVKECGADFVKTATGFWGGGATIEDIEVMSQITNGVCRVKAAGGIRDRETAIRMIKAGASRLGSSAGISIVSGDTPFVDSSSPMEY